MQYSRNSSSFSTLEYRTIMGMILSRCSPTLWPACRLFNKNQQQQQINVLKKENEGLTDFYLSTKAFFSPSSSQKFEEAVGKGP